MLDLSFWNYILFYGTMISAASFLIILFLTPKVIKSLIAKGSVVQDYHKPERPNIPRPAGPILLIGIAVAEIILYFLTRNTQVLAILLTTIIAFIVGLIDDKKVMPGWYKPIALIPVAGNTINSIDVLNGVASEAVIVAMIPLLVSIAVFGNTVVFLAALPLFFGMIAFYKFHRFPSKIFPGDSGTLLIGAMYGALAIAGSSEIIGVIALLPSVMNSFLFLDSVKKIVEHRQVKARPTVLMEDFKLMASKEKNAPTTLLRLILADGPLSEKEIGKKILKLAIYSSILALLTVVIQYYFLSPSFHK